MPESIVGLGEFQAVVGVGAVGVFEGDVVGCSGGAGGAAGVFEGGFEGGFGIGGRGDEVDVVGGVFGERLAEEPGVARCEAGEGGGVFA